MGKTKRFDEEEDVQSDDGSEESTSSEEGEAEEEVEQGYKEKGPKVKRTKMSDLPTKDEQLQLNNTDTLLRSNLLKLQVEEMLKEVSCQEIYKKKKIQKVLTECINLLEEVKGSDIEGKEITSSWLKKEGLRGFDLMESTEGHLSTPTSITLTAPESVGLCGSFKLHTATSPFVNFDIAVTMPANMFEVSDILNQAYFKKRALYLGALCAHFKEKGFITDENCTVALMKGDARKPVMQVKMPLKGLVAFVRVLPVMPNTVFKLVQLRPSKNNVRPAFWSGKGDAETLEGTPHYSAAVFEDIAGGTQLQFLEQTLSSCEVAKELVVLFKIWLSKRGMRSRLDGVDSHTCTLLVAYLVQTRRLTSKITPIGALTLLLKFIAETNFANSVMDFTKTQMGANDADYKWPVTLLYPVFDRSREDKEVMAQYNVLWRVSESALSELIAEAQKSSRVLQTHHGDLVFKSLFMDCSSFYERHDLFFHIPLRVDALPDSSAHKKSISATLTTKEDAPYAARLQKEMENEVCDKLAHQSLIARVTALARAALGNRVKMVHAAPMRKGDGDSGNLNHETTFQPAWLYTTAAQDRNVSQWSVVIGLVLDRDSCHRVVERGPAADDATRLPEFRRFWGGDKCQIRRFQDGSIIEAVVWDQEASARGWVPRGERIVEEVLRHVLARHLPGYCGRGSSKVVSKSSQPEQFFLPGNVCGPSETGESTPDEDAESLFRRATEKLDQLRKIVISDLKDIPLVIDSILAVGASMRYTGIMPPIPHPLLMARDTKAISGEHVSLVAVPIPVVATVEGGGKWPKKRDAIVKVKLALLLRIAEQMKKQFDIKSVPHEENLDILFGGYIFRLSLMSSLEVERNIIDDNPFSRVPLPRELLEKMELNALHVNHIRSLQSQHNSFGPTVRLLLTWLCGHNLSGLLPVKILELLVASVYLQPGTLAPSSSSAGLYRTLTRIATFDWENSPLLVDFGSDMNQAVEMRVNTHFREIREMNKSIAMFIVSSCDKFFDYEPCLAVRSTNRITLNIIRRKASESMRLHSTWLQDAACDDFHSIKSFMVSSDLLDGCDVILHFSSALVNRKAVHRFGNDFLKYHSQGPNFARLRMFANLSDRELSTENLLVVEGELTPLHESMVESLRAAFGDIAVFFWNSKSATKVGVMWRPTQFLARKFSVLLSRHTVVAEGTNSTHSAKNSTEIVREMVKLSKGLIETVDFK